MAWWDTLEPLRGLQNPYARIQGPTSVGGGLAQGLGDAAQIGQERLNLLQEQDQANQAREYQQLRDVVGDSQWNWQQRQQQTQFNQKQMADEAKAREERFRWDTEQKRLLNRDTVADEQANRKFKLDTTLGIGGLGVQRQNADTAARNAGSTALKTLEGLGSSKSSSSETKPASPISPRDYQEARKVFSMILDDKRIRKNPVLQEQLLGLAESGVIPQELYQLEIPKGHAKYYDGQYYTELYRVDSINPNAVDPTQRFVPFYIGIPYVMPAGMQ